jgi:RNA polymerase sigma factor (sigma-70 family)
MHKPSFEEVFAKNEKMIRVLSSKYRVNGYEKDDLYQEFSMVCHKCWQNFDVEKKTRFSTYLYRSIMLNLYNLIKKQPEPTISLNEAALGSEETLDFLDMIMSDCDSPEEEDIHQEDFELVYSTIMSLPNGQVTIDKIMGGKTYLEIGKELGLTKARVFQIHQENLTKAREIIKGGK